MVWVVTQNSRFYLHEGESLLDGLLRTGHDVNYQCKSGYCGSCRVRLHTSTHAVTYAQSPLAMIDENEILACCCQLQGMVHIGLFTYG